MMNVTNLYIDKFEYGCKISFLISVYESGPFLPGKQTITAKVASLFPQLVAKNKFYPRAQLRKVRFGMLPCKYIKIIVHEGVHLHPSQIHIFGFPAEETGKRFGFEFFETVVANPQRLMYS